MKLFRKSLPVVCFLVLLLFFIGWSWLDWATTRLIPWSVAVLAVFVCSLSWAMSTTVRVRQINAVLTLAAAILGMLLVSGIAAFSALWTYFTLTGFASALLYLYAVASNSSLYKGAMHYMLLLPPALVLYALIALFGWNGALLPAWIGLLLMLLFAVIGLLSPQKTQKS